MGSNILTEEVQDPSQKRTLVSMRVGSWLFVLFGLIGSQAQATSFISKSFPDSVKDAPVIVRGVIGMSYADEARTSEGGKRIYTYYELTPSEVFKGALPMGSIIVRQIGGTKEGVVMEVPGTARFSRGEEVVLMLSQQNLDGSLDIRGLMMGKFSIQKMNGKEYLVGAGAITPDQVEQGEVEHGNHEEENRSTSAYSVEDLRNLVQLERTVDTSKQPVPIQVKNAESPQLKESSDLRAPMTHEEISNKNVAPKKPEIQAWVWGLSILIFSFISYLFIRRA